MPTTSPTSCPGCGAPATAAAPPVRCAACGTTFDPAARAHPPPRAPRPGEAPCGVEVEKDPGSATATLTWWKVWKLRGWPAASVALLHLVLIAIGVYSRAWAAVALLAAVVAAQGLLYWRALTRRTTVHASGERLRVAHTGLGAPAPLSLERAEVAALYVLEVAPVGRAGQSLPPSKRRTRAYALCADAPHPRLLVGALPTAAHAFLLEDVVRVTLGVPSRTVKGALPREAL